MKKSVPFYSNTSDNLHCFQAVIRMVLKYYFPKRNYSWKMLEKMTDKKKGFYTWIMKGLISLRKMGLEVINMEDFDYEKFIKNTKSYLIKKYGEEAGKVQIKFTNIAQEKINAKKFIKVFGKKTIRPSLQDIKKLLNDDYLIICCVNARALNNKKGYSGHFVLLFNFDTKNIYLHDPGLPGKKNRKVSITRFDKAWSYPSLRERNLIAIKK